MPVGNPGHDATGGQTMSEERTPEDYRKAADDSLELARVLAGEGRISDQDFLERMAQSDALADHDRETCGMCCNIRIAAQVAVDTLAATDDWNVSSTQAEES